MSDDSLISFAEAGRLLGGVCEKTVRRRIAAGELPKPIREGKFSRLFRSDILKRIEDLKQQRQKGKSDVAIRH